MAAVSAPPSTVLVAGEGALADRTAHLAAARYPGARVSTDSADDAWELIVAIGQIDDGVWDVLAPGGTLIAAGAGSGSSLDVDAGRLVAGEHTILGTGGGARQDLVDLLLWMRDAGFEPELGEVHGLDEVKTAMSEVETTGRSAAVLIE